MEHVKVEYAGGPVDGRQEMLPVGPDGAPPPDRLVTTDPLPERWDNVHAPTPAVPPQAHRYVREIAVRARDVTVWLYRHRGALA